MDGEHGTEAEFKMALQFFPKILSRKKVVVLDNNKKDCIIADDDQCDYPIHCLLHRYDCEFMLNLKAFPFIHLFAQLAIEFGLFEDH